MYMNENSPHENQERNLALERQEAVALYNDLLKEQETFSEEDKSFDIKKGGFSSSEFEENLSKTAVLRKKVETIDEYRTLATSKEDLAQVEIGDSSDIEKIKQEKEKIDTEIKKYTRDIDRTKSELNDLRKKLDLPETDDIPALSDKKEQISCLMAIKEELETKLHFALQKEALEKTKENTALKRENKNLAESFETFSSGIQKVASLLEKRKSNGYNPIFKDEEAMRAIAQKIGISQNAEEMKADLSKFASIVEEFADNRNRGANDNPESLYDMVSALRQLSPVLEELTKSTHNEEEKGIAQVAASVVEKINAASSAISQKAETLQRFVNLTQR